MSKESRAINELVELGLSRREANHIVRDEGLSSGKFRQAREQGIKKQNARAAQKAARVGRGSSRGLFGGRVRNNRREY